jgi:hypothetical protein
MLGPISLVLENRPLVLEMALLMLRKIPLVFSTQKNTNSNIRAQYFNTRKHRAKRQMIDIKMFEKVSTQERPKMPPKIEGGIFWHKRWAKNAGPKTESRTSKG